MSLDITSPMRKGMQSQTSTPSEVFPPHRILLVAPSPPPYGGMALQGRLLEKLLREEALEVVVFASNAPLPGWLRSIERLPGLRTAMRLIMTWPRLWAEAGQAEIIHIFAASWLYFFLVVYPAVIVGRARGRRIILNYRGGEAERFFHFYGWAIGNAFRLAHAVTAPSEFLARPIRKRFGVAVSIVPNLLDSSAFPYKERLIFRPKILVNRHLEAIYDIESVLKAFGLIQKRYSEASLEIAGTGTEEDRLRSLVSAWNLQNVRFLGHVSHRDLRAAYDQCDILINASRIDNFPGALIEASGSGLVVVSTGAGGIPSIYENQKSALLVDVGDWQGLARSVETVLEDPSLAAELTKAALVAVRGCDWAEVRKSLYRAYGFAAQPTREDRAIKGTSISRSSGSQLRDELRADAPASTTPAIGN